MVNCRTTITVIMTGRFFMKQLTTAISLVLVIAAAPLQANNTMNAADMAEQSEQAVPQKDVDEQVDEAIEAFFNRRGLTEGEVGKGGKIYYSATERVAVNQASRDWAKARQITFEKALLNIRSRFIADNFGRITNETASKLYSDDSSDSYEFPKDLSGVGRVEALWDKLAAGTDAKLNQWLEEMGVDSSEFDSVPPVERKDLFVDRYISKTLQKAMGDSSGILPMQTFVGSDEKGNTHIGVIALYSPKLKQLASDIARQKPPMLKGKAGKPMASYIELSDETLAAQFGIRVVFDPEGAPVLLSYGQWGYSYEGANDSRIARARKTSYEVAETKASEAMANFINNQIVMEGSIETGQIVSNHLERQGAEISEKDITTLVEKMMKTVNSTASAKLDGTRRLKKWRYKTEQGHEIVGVIRAWTMSGLKQARAVQNFKPQRARTTAGGATAEESFSSGVSAGAVLMDNDEDF